jgi:hypothetical protein
MATIEPIGKSNNAAMPSDATVRHIRFVPQAGVGQEVLLDFVDPVSQKAVCVSSGPLASEPIPGTAVGDGIDLLIVAGQPQDHLGWSDEPLKWVAASAVTGTTPPIAVTIHGAQVIWGSDRAAILAAPDRVAPFLLALVDFCYYENEIRKLEREIGECWPLLEMDTPLAHDVTALDPERFDSVGQRMEQTLRRRMHLARLEPHLVQPRRNLPPLANQLIERLREKAHIEDRLEALDSQLDVFERIYEMSSQRISDFKAAQQSRTLEWVIIVLLAAEGLLLLVDLLWLMKV